MEQKIHSLLLFVYPPKQQLTIINTSQQPSLIEMIRQINTKKDDFFITLAKNNHKPSNWDMESNPKQVPNVNQQEKRAEDE